MSNSYNFKKIVEEDKFRKRKKIYGKEEKYKKEEMKRENKITILTQKMLYIFKKC